MGYLEDSLDLPLGRALEAIQHRILEETRYFGVKALKNPFDFWIYQEILFELRPDVIIEIGNYHGGSMLALAHLCDALGNGRVIGIDLTHDEVPEIVRRHARVVLIAGAATEVLGEVRRLIAPHDRVLIIEDSAHTYENTLGVLRAYSGLVSDGSYMIVEDGICHHGLDVGPSPGPYEAIETFINETDEFEIDRTRESFLITWNPKGFLRRVRRGREPV